MSSPMSTFTISQYPYSYTTAAPAPHQPPMRQYSGYGTSSAFSSSANPDEDWTKISDLAERRRIQNRIAQRNYRKKLKRRLEDLERRAGSSDEGENEKPTQAKANTTPSKATSPRRQLATKAQKPSPVQTQQQTISSHGQFTPPMDNQDKGFLGSVADDFDRSRTSPPVFNNYNAYPSTDDFIMNPYAQTQSYPDVSVASQYPSYLGQAATAPPAPAMSSTLPSLQHFHDASVAVKREAYPDEGINSYLNYNCGPTFDMGMANPFDNSAPHTPPLSHSYDHSGACSESGFDYPYTPLSPPGSPSGLYLNRNSQR